MKRIFAALGGSIFVLSMSPAFSQEGERFVFGEGNLLLGVQATGGTGSSTNVFFDLGPAHELRDSGSPGVVGNLAADLAASFGNDWFSRGDLWFGVFGNRNNLDRIFPGGNPENGDPSRTLYVSRTASAPGQAILWGPYGAASLGSTATRFAGMKGVFNDPGVVEPLVRTASGAAILVETDHPVEWNNSWSKWNPTPGAGFGTFAGGIQANFGKDGPVSVDIQRILAYSQGADPAGPVGRGEYISTVTISADGTIRVEKAGEGGGDDTPFELWIAGFAGITDEADKAPLADPDRDGVPNLLEFAFGGDPSDAGSRGTRMTEVVAGEGDESELVLTVEVLEGAVFTAQAGAMVSTVDGISYRIEGSRDLAAFSASVAELTPHRGSGAPAAGYEFRSFRLTGEGDLGFLRATATLD